MMNTDTDGLTATVAGIVITPQDSETLYVRTPDSYTDRQDENVSSIDVGRGIRVRVNGHVFLQPDGSLAFFRHDRPAGQYYGNPSLHRIDDSLKDVPEGARKRACNMILAAAAEYLAANDDALSGAQENASWKAAAERRELMNKLGDQINRLEREALALEAGGREVYKEHRYQSGFHETVKHVETADGELLPSLPEVVIYGADKYGPALPGDTNDYNSYSHKVL